MKTNSGLMREFFYGWRRKAGTATLLFAIALMTGWIRSLATFDEINCPLGREYAIAIASWKGALAIRIGWDKYDSWDEFVWNSRDDDYHGYTDPNSTFYRFAQPIPDGSGCFVTWYLLGDAAGIGATPLHQRSYCRMMFAIAPYWSVTLPLTLLSAYLICGCRESER